MVNSRSGRVCANKTSSGESGGSAVDRGAGGVREERKREDRANPKGGEETSSGSKRASTAVVKVEGGVAMSALSGTAEAVRYVD